MTTQYDVTQLQPAELADYGFARVRDVAFDAVHDLWERRRHEGMKQLDIAQAIGKDPAWISRRLRGPGNWTVRTIGEFLVALRGEIEIKVHALEDPLPVKVNYHAYAGYELPVTSVASGTAIQSQVAARVEQTTAVLKRAFPTDGSSNVSAVPVTVP